MTPPTGHILDHHHPLFSSMLYGHRSMWTPSNRELRLKIILFDI